MTRLSRFKSQCTAIGAVLRGIAVALLTRGLHLPHDNRGWSYP